MRVAICWHSISGYMAACWRALAATPGVDLLVVTQKPDAKGATPFDTALVAGVRTALVDPDKLNDPEGVHQIVADFKPDVVVINGWFVPAYTRLASSPRLSGARFIMPIDRPRVHPLKDWINKLRYRRLISRMDVMFVTGERCWAFARFLGVPESRIRRGTYGVDAQGLAPLLARRAARPQGWPRSFVFMGRYAPEKGLDVLVEAYKGYRAAVSDPWPLITCGRGDQASLLKGVPGIEDRGFVQPADQAALLAEQGVFVMASRFDPWPLVIVEACAAGLPVVCSNACGSAVEVVRSYDNGIQVATGDAPPLTRAMIWMHQNHSRLPQMGARSQSLGAAYSAQLWAVRYHEAFRDLLATPA